MFPPTEKCTTAPSSRPHATKTNGRYSARVGHGNQSRLKAQQKPTLRRRTKMFLRCCRFFQLRNLCSRLFPSGNGAVPTFAEMASAHNFLYFSTQINNSPTRASDLCNRCVNSTLTQSDWAPHSQHRRTFAQQTGVVGLFTLLQTAFVGETTDRKKNHIRSLFHSTSW